MKIPLTFLLLLFNLTITQAQTVPLVKGPLTWTTTIELRNSAFGFSANGGFVIFGNIGKLILNVTTPQNSAGFFLVTGYGMTVRRSPSDAQSFPIVGSFIPVDATYKYSDKKPVHYILTFSVQSNEVICKLDPSTLNGTCFRETKTFPMTFQPEK